MTFLADCFIMDILEFREFCISLPLVEETTPFDEDTLVYKIGGKMFVYTSISEFRYMCLKADPEQIPDLIDRHAEIGPPVHMSKKHWISVVTGGDLPDEFIRSLIRDSYRLVIEAMPKKKRNGIMDEIGKSCEWMK